MNVFGEFAPDQPALDSGGQFSMVSKTLILSKKHSYALLRSLLAVTNALDNNCQRAASFRVSTGAVNSFARDTSTLY